MNDVLHKHDCVCGKVTVIGCACTLPGVALIERCCVEEATREVEAKKAAAK